MYKSFFVAGILFLLATVGAQAQTAGVSLNGHISNADNIPVAGATVTLRTVVVDPAIPSTYVTTTDPNGNYQINNIVWFRYTTVEYKLYVSSAGNQDFVSSTFFISPIRPTSLV